MKTSQPDLLRHLPAIAAQRLPPGISDPATAARHLSGGRILNVIAPAIQTGSSDGTGELLDPHYPPVVQSEREGMMFPGETATQIGQARSPISAAGLSERLRANVVFVEDPDDSDVTLIVHAPDANARATAAEVENQIILGRRVVLVDSSQLAAQRADPDLLIALTNTSVYTSNLAAYDITLERALAVALTPLRDGSAHRRYLVETMLYSWAWRSIVEDEVRRTFGEVIPEKWMLRATTQARSRLGAYLMKLRGRGLRYFIRVAGFEDNRVDGFWFDLVADS